MKSTTLKILFAGMLLWAGTLELQAFLPGNTVPGDQSAAVNTPLVFSTASGNPISVSDADNPASLEVTLEATRGTLTLAGAAGLTFTSGDGTDDALMTFSGSITDINAALEGLTFTPTTNYRGSASLEITTTDVDGTAEDTISIRVRRLVSHMIQRGLMYLLSNQQEDGSWYNYGYPVAETSMAVLALLNAGYSREDTAVANGLDYIMSRIPADRETWDGSLGSYPNYCTSMAIMALAASRNPDYHDELAKMRDWLITAQYRSEGSDYDGSFSYYGGGSGDLSNSQWSLMGLSASDGALGLDADADNSTYQAAIGWIDRCREGAHNYNGGCLYNPSDDRFTPCMTAAGVWSYALCGIGTDDARVLELLDWLAANYSWNYTNARIYQRVTMAKALVMSHKTKLGEHDWFSDLTDVLAAEQQGNGSWNTGDWLDGGAVMDTAFGVMALQTRTLPEGVDARLAVLLASHADVHIYDPLGRHTGINYDSMTVETNIPDSEYLLYNADAEGNPTGDPIPFPQDGNIPEDVVQVINIPLSEAGSYRIELVGTSDGDYKLTIQGTEDGEVVSTDTQEGDITEGQKLATTATVTAIEGSTTLIFQDLKQLASFSVSPAHLELSNDPGSVQEFAVTITETSGNEDLKGVSVYFMGPVGTITDENVVFDTTSFNLAAGGETEVNVSVTVPEDFTLPVTMGNVVIESSNGGTRTVNISPPAEFTLDKTRADHDNETQQGTISLTADTVTDSLWNAQSNADWLTIVSGHSGYGDGTITYQMQENNTPLARFGTITVAGQAVSVNQYPLSVFATLPLDIYSIYTGWIANKYFPWVWHFEHGWWYVLPVTENSAWLWDLEAGWLYAAESYPWLYSVDRDCWLWYYAGGPSGRWFTDSCTGELIDFPKSQ